MNTGKSYTNITQKKKPIELYYMHNAPDKKVMPYADFSLNFNNRDYTYT